MIAIQNLVDPADVNQCFFSADKESAMENFRFELGDAVVANISGSYDTLCARVIDRRRDAARQINLYEVIYSDRDRRSGENIHREWFEDFLLQSLEAYQKEVDEYFKNQLAELEKNALKEKALRRKNWLSRLFS